LQQKTTNPWQGNTEIVSLFLPVLFLKKTAAPALFMPLNLEGL
jgi:hypothetical protein